MALNTRMQSTDSNPFGIHPLRLNLAKLNTYVTRMGVLSTALDRMDPILMSRCVIHRDLCLVTCLPGAERLMFRPGCVVAQGLSTYLNNYGFDAADMLGQMLHSSFGRGEDGKPSYDKLADEFLLWKDHHSTWQPFPLFRQTHMTRPNNFWPSVSQLTLTDFTDEFGGIMDHLARPQSVQTACAVLSGPGPLSPPLFTYRFQRKAGVADEAEVTAALGNHLNSSSMSYLVFTDNTNRALPYVVQNVTAGIVRAFDLDAQKWRDIPMTQVYSIIYHNQQPPTPDQQQSHSLQLRWHTLANWHPVVRRR